MYKLFAETHRRRKKVNEHVHVNMYEETCSNEPVEKACWRQGIRRAIDFTTWTKRS